ncbi:MAG: transposase [Rickettsiales bacterium]|jgi:putative transposase|nr:transposase [Rickettsiales bacterium]
MLVNYAYKFRLYPTKEQQVLLAKHFGCNRFVWNYFLNERQQYYLNNKEDIETERIKGILNYYDNAKELTRLKSTEEYNWLKECNSQSLQSTLKYLDTAYRMFFKKIARFPNFKSKDSKQSFTIPQFLTIENNKGSSSKLHIPKFKEGIKVKQHRNIDFEKEKFVTATLSKNCSNEYYLSIIVEKEIQQQDKLTKVIGIDVGIKDFCVCSDGTIFENKKYLSKYEKKLKYQQRKLSKKKKKSKKKEDVDNNKAQGKNRNKAKIKVAKIHNKISNSRVDHLYKISKRITDENQIICLEDLNIKGMQQNHHLAKAVGDCSWNTFNTLLEYKAKWKGRTMVKIDRYFPSSQVCSNCGYQNTDLKDLKIREWTCPRCNMKHNRDINASINILKQGLNLINKTSNDNSSDYNSKNSNGNYNSNNSNNRDCHSKKNGGRDCRQKLGELSSIEEAKNQETKSQETIKAQFEAQSSLAIG